MGQHGANRLDLHISIPFAQASDWAPWPRASEHQLARAHQRDVQLRPLSRLIFRRGNQELPK